MKKRIALLFTLSGCLYFSKHAAAQSIVRDVQAASAETLTKGDFSLTFVLGEVVGDLLTNKPESKFLTVGFLQPDIELKQLVEATNRSIVVYPNPSTTGQLKLAFNDLPDAVYTIEVIDGLGRILQKQNVTYTKDSFLYLPINISAYARGIYFVRVKNSLDFSGQVKVIKL